MVTSLGTLWHPIPLTAVRLRTRPRRPHRKSLPQPSVTSPSRVPRIQGSSDHLWFRLPALTSLFLQAGQISAIFYSNIPISYNVFPDLRRSILSAGLWRARSHTHPFSALTYIVTCSLSQPSMLTAPITYRLPWPWQYNLRLRTSLRLERPLYVPCWQVY